MFNPEIFIKECISLEGNKLEVDLDSMKQYIQENLDPEEIFEDEVLAE